MPESLHARAIANQHRGSPKKRPARLDRSVAPGAARQRHGRKCRTRSHQEARCHSHSEQFREYGRTGEGGFLPGNELGGFQEQHPQHPADATGDQQRSRLAHHPRRSGSGEVLRGAQDRIRAPRAGRAAGNRSQHPREEAGRDSGPEEEGGNRAEARKGRRRLRRNCQAVFGWQHQEPGRLPRRIQARGALQGARGCGLQDEAERPHRPHGACHARISQDAAGAELRRHQTRLSGHCRRRKLRDSGSERHAGSFQAEEGPQEIPPVREAVEFGTMKTPFVTDLNSEQSITTFFLVHEKEIRNTREGKPYLRLELGDRSGTIEARMWDQFDLVVKNINRDDFVKVNARVEIYRNRPQLSLQQLRLAKPEEIDLADFLPHTKENVEKLFAQLQEFAASISNPWLNKLVTGMISNPTVAAKYKRAPAAKVMHHAYLGGLIEHVLSLCGLAKQAAAHYPEVDVDLLLTAAILHDVGKLEELCFERAIGYTVEGQLLGHIMLEFETVSKAMDAIEGFPANLKTVVQHLLISHHGQYEFGSPKLPMIREALVFHYLDDLDSKLAAVRAALALDSGEPEWSAYSGALGRKFLRLEEFLKDFALTSPGKK